MMAMLTEMKFQLLFIAWMNDIDIIAEKIK